MSNSLRLGLQVKEALKTVEAFLNSSQVTNYVTSVDKINNIRLKFNDLRASLNEIIEQLDKNNAVANGAVKKTNGEKAVTNGSTESVDFGKYITQQSKNRKPSCLRELTILYYKMPPDTIFLGVGAPNPDMYPFDSVHAKLKDGTSLEMSGDRLKMVLSYLPSAGYTPLNTLLKGFQDKVHGAIDWDKKDILMTSGAQEGTHHAVAMLLNPGDPLLVQNPMYPGFSEIFKPLDIESILINMDRDGLIPEHLAKVLQERSRSGLKMPKVLYVNPTASNPTGTLLSDERKVQIYKIAQQYELIIMEDDPYYFVHFLDKNPRSFLSLDTDQRVIRFDSFSKTLSSGLRVGYVTAAKPFIERLNLHVQVTTMQCSGLAQLLCHELLSTWGYEGYCKYLTKLRQFYKTRRDNALRAADKYLTGLGTWHIPQGGMFLWVTLSPVQDLRKLITEECVEGRLLVAPGYAFNVDEADERQYVRISYSIAAEDEVTEGLRRLGQLIKANLK